MVKYSWICNPDETAGVTGPDPFNFLDYIDTVLEVLEFREKWGIDEFHDSYVYFKEALYHMNPEYIEKQNPLDLMREWVSEFYSPATPETHDYWVRENHTEQ